MEIYFLRHAIAVERTKQSYPNDDRPLTKEGRKKMRRAAGGIRALLGRIDTIVSSPLVRSQDTAKIVAKALRYKRNIVLCEALLPESSLEEVVKYLGKFKESSRVLLVGHEPLLGMVVSSLLGSTESIIELKKGGLCCIAIPNVATGKNGQLRFHLEPKHLRNLA